MTPEIIEYILFILCLFFSGFYSGSEAALVSIPVDRTKQLLEAGGRRGRALSFLLNRPTEVLTTILICNNLVNIYAASLTTRMATRYFANDAVGFSVGVTTFLILIFGEIIPKTFARARAEKMAPFIIVILRMNYYALWPFVRFFTWIIQRVLGKDAQLRGRVVTRDDIEFLVNKAEREQSIDSKQIDLLSSILDFPKIKVKDIMVARSDIQFVKQRVSFNDIIRLIRKEGHSRYPVANNDIDSVTGMLHVKDLAFVREKDRKNFDLQKYTKPPFFVYEHMKIQAVFDHMNRNKAHMALVKDEGGLIVGMITQEDIIEEIFGDIHDEHDTEEVIKDETQVIDLAAGIKLEGKTSLRDLDNDYDIEIPLNDEYSTLAGFLLHQLGNAFPQEGSMVLWSGYSFELLDVKDFDIGFVSIKKIHQGQEEEDLEEGLHHE